MSFERLPLCLAALLLAAGCGDSEGGVTMPCGSAQVQGIQQPPVPFLSVGAVSAVPVQAGEIPFALCPEQQQGRPLAPDTVTSEVHGPDGLLVPSTIELNPGGSSATLRFTPPRPGAYHAIVAFSPVGGLQQFDMLAGTDRSGLVPVAELTRSSCAHVDRTPRGTWFCDGAMLRPPSQQWQLLASFATVAVAGDVVWVSELGRVRRYVDTGTSLELTGTLTPGTRLLDSSSRLATGEELVLLTDAGLHRITFTEGQGLTEWPTLPWPGLPVVLFGEDSIKGLLLRAGDGLLRVHTERQDGTGEEAARACPLRLGAQGGYVPTGEPCQTLVGPPVAGEADALWTATTRVELIGDMRMRRETLYRWSMREGRLVDQSLPLQNVADVRRQSLGGGSSVPVLGPATGTPSVAVAGWDAERGALALELIALPGADGPRASPRFLWTRGYPVRVFAR